MYDDLIMLEENEQKYKHVLVFLVVLLLSISVDNSMSYSVRDHISKSI